MTRRLKDRNRSLGQSIGVQKVVDTSVLDDGRFDVSKAEYWWIPSIALAEWSTGAGFWVTAKMRLVAFQKCSHRLRIAKSPIEFFEAELGMQTSMNDVLSIDSTESILSLIQDQNNFERGNRVRPDFGYACGYSANADVSKWLGSQQEMWKSFCSWVDPSKRKAWARAYAESDYKINAEIRKCILSKVMFVSIPLIRHQFLADVVRVARDRFGLKRSDGPWTMIEGASYSWGFFLAHSLLFIDLGLSSGAREHPDKNTIHTMRDLEFIVLATYFDGLESGDTPQICRYETLIEALNRS